MHINSKHQRALNLTPDSCKWNVIDLKIYILKGTFSDALAFFYLETVFFHILTKECKKTAILYECFEHLLTLAAKETAFINKAKIETGFKCRWARYCLAWFYKYSARKTWTNRICCTIQICNIFSMENLFTCKTGWEVKTLQSC